MPLRRRQRPTVKQAKQGQETTGSSKQESRLVILHLSYFYIMDGRTKDRKDERTDVSLLIIIQSRMQQKRRH